MLQMCFGGHLANNEYDFESYNYFIVPQFVFTPLKPQNVLPNGESIYF